MRIVAALLIVWAALLPSTAFADPPVATDYRSSVVAIDPPTPTVHVSIVGGDSFVSLRVDRGTSVDVVGYSGEPYLRFLPTGEVLENRASVTYYTSRSRYGSSVPASVGPSTPPQWERVATDGEYVWHDHRTHWMNPSPPLGRHPGDVILEARVPLVVDGGQVSVEVISTWEPAPSPVAAWLGLAAGAVLAAAAVVWRRHRPVAVAIVAVAGVAALVTGMWQFRSVPALTGPTKLSWALPVAGLLAVVAAGAMMRQAWWAWAAVAVAGGELLVWSWLRRRHLSAAVLPTNAPFWLDRAVTAAVFVGAAAVTAVAIQQLLGRPPRRLRG